ncbi:MAG: V-type ATPase subunit [bacterium]
MISLARYGATNAVIRTLLSDLLGKDDYQSIAGAESIDGAWTELRKTAYGRWIPVEAPAQLLEIEKILNQVSAEHFRRGLRLLKGKSLKAANILLSRWELDDLEFALRIWHRGERYLARYLHFPSLVNNVPIHEIVEAESIEAIALALRHTPYFEPIAKAIPGYKEKRSIFYIEIELEKDYYSRLSSAVSDLGGTDSREGLKIISMEIDLVNLMLIRRLVEYFDVQISSIRDYAIRGGSEISERVISQAATKDSLVEIQSKFFRETPLSLSRNDRKSSILVLEKLVRMISVRTASRALLAYPFAITCIFAFYLLKRNELLNLRAIFSARELGVEQSQVMSLLYLAD